MKTKRRWTASKALLAAVSLGGALEHGTSATAGEASRVALVMQVSGTTTPQMVVRREVADGTRITLGAQSRLSLMHYESCSIVTLSGGTATVSAKGIEAPDAFIESKKPGPCPKFPTLDVGSTAPIGGSTNMRSINPPTALTEVSPGSEIILTGANAASAAYADVLDGYSRQVASKVVIRDGSFTLDSNVLGRNSPYSIRILRADQTAIGEIPALVVPSASGGMLIVRLD